jgi:hypothetical protein
MIKSDLECGYKVLSASGVVGDSGKPIAIYGYAFVSDGTAGVITFKDGTTTGGTAVFSDTGTVSSWKTGPNCVGVPMFTTGLFVSLDAHVTGATVFYRQAYT